MLKHISILVIVVFATVNAFSQKNPAWTTRYNDTGDYSDHINNILVDASGNIYLSGYTVNTGSNKDYLTIKLNSAGDTLWTRTVNGPDNGPDEILAMATDASGFVYVTGYIKGVGTADDILTIKYNSMGDTVWTRTFNHTANEDDQANSIFVDASGNVYVAGQVDNDPTSGNNDDYITIKYNSSGVQQWAVRYGGASNGTDRIVKVLVDTASAVYVTGRSWNGFDDDYLTIKYNASGVQQWIKIYDRNDTDRPVSMAIDASSNIIVTGRSNNGQDDDYVTVKYNSAGVQQWARVLDGAGGGHDRPSTVVADAAGNIYVTGQSDSDPTAGKNMDVVTLKYNASGVLLWNRLFNGSANKDDIPTDIKVDGSNNVFVCGYSNTAIGPQPINNDMFLIKYNGSGVLQWNKSHGGTASGEDIASAVGIDGAGNGFITGSASNAGSQLDATTIKYDSAGNVVWTKSFIGKGDNFENANSVITDPAGNIYVAGYSVNTFADRDMLTMKLNAQGSISWVKRFNGSSSLTDEATGIAVDNSGFVFVTGFARNRTTLTDYTTIKYSPTGDTVWTRTYNHTANQSDKAVAISLDASGNVYVTGESDSDPTMLSNDDFATIKYNTNGALQWVSRFNGSANGNDRAIGMSTSASAVYVTGRSSNGTDDDIVTIKYDATNGSQVWIATYNFGSGNDRPTAIKTDASGNVYISGYSRNANGDDDCVAIKYNAAGSELWARRYSSPGMGDDRANTIDVDADGNVYVGGQIDTDPAIGRSLDCVTIKYNSAGTEQWVRSYNGLAFGDDFISSVKVDAQGVVFVAGESDNGGAGVKNKDFITLTYDSTGTLLWKGIYDGPTSGSDGANTMALSNNELIVAGGSWGGGSQRDLLVLIYTQITSLTDIKNAGKVKIETHQDNLVFNFENMQLAGKVISFRDILGRVSDGGCIDANGRLVISTVQKPPGIYTWELRTINGMPLTGKFMIH